MNSHHPIASRKQNHLKINLTKNVSSGITTGLEKYRFIHCALPELNLSQIDTSVDIYNHKLQFPLLISSMTGGVSKATEINFRLAKAAQEYRIAMGVGSQRIMLREKNPVDSFQLRKIAPNILLFANLGAVQLNDNLTADDCRRIVDAIKADALIMHVNPLQEALMDEGDTNFSGLLHKLEIICKAMDVPVVVKEVGWGISEKVAKSLFDIGVSAVDVAGAGGTSWSEVEKFRTVKKTSAIAAEGFLDWGIPTSDCLVEIVRNHPDRLIFASGGLKNGIDVVKCVALGASMGGIARPLLLAAADSEETLREKLNAITSQIKIVMFCTGSKDIKDLRNKKITKI